MAKEIKREDRIETYSKFYASIPPKYKSACIASSRWSKEEDELISKWMKKKNGILLLMGRPGCGKTFTAFSLAKNELETRFKKNLKDHADPSKCAFFFSDTFLFFDCFTLFMEFKKTFGDVSEEISLLNSIIRSEFFILDDLGADQNTEWQISKIKHIVDQRYVSEKPTVVTTNLTFDEIGKKMDDRIRSRLQDDSNLIIENWIDDYRCSHKDKKNEKP